MARVIEMDEATAARMAFEEPALKGDLVPHAGTGTQISTHDGIITAQKVAVPRDENTIRRKIKERAAWAGDDWGYRFPVKDKNGKTEWIEGPSIKCANSVFQLFGNNQLDTRVMDSGETWTIYARYVDLETGSSYTRPFQQRKSQESMKTKADRARDIALQIGVSKCIRNVICNALEFFTTFAHEEAKKNIVEKVGKDLPKFREKVLSRLAEMKVDVKRVEGVRGRAVKDWLAPDVALTIAEMQSIQDGMATIDETWPGEAPTAPSRDDPKPEGDKKPEAEKATDKPAQADGGPSKQETEKKAEEKKPETTGKVEEPDPAAEWDGSFCALDQEGEIKYAGPDQQKFALAFVNAMNAVSNDKALVAGIWETNEGQLKHCSAGVVQLVERHHQMLVGTLV